MKKSFLPTSLLLVIITLAQVSLFAQGDARQGKYVPRVNPNSKVDAYFTSVRANQNTGLIDPADLLVKTPVATAKSGEELNWINIGPDNFGGLVSSFVFPDPTNGNTVLLGTMGAGIYKTTNNGTTWSCIQSNLLVSCMTRANDGKIYIGTGDGKGAQKYNPLGELGYAYSFAGSGIYVLDGDELSKIYNPDSVLFINEIAVDGTTIYAATDKGIIKAEAGSTTWTNILPGDATCVKAASNGNLFAGVSGQVYKKAAGETSFAQVVCPCVSSTQAVPKTVQLAIAPSNEDVVYASFIKADGYSLGIFVSTNGLADSETWSMALPESSVGSYTFNIFEGYGNYNHVVTVFPNNPFHILIGSNEIWELTSADDSQPSGMYIANKLSSGTSEAYNPSYAHLGIKAITFSPTAPNQAFIGTNGGVFKGLYTNGEGFSFSDCNRFIIGEGSTSTARMLSVVPSNEKHKVLSTSLDHGTIGIRGNATVNSIEQGVQIYPLATAFEGFSYDKASASCAQSIINPKAIFVTTESGKLQRSETYGNDYDISNFNSDDNFSDKYSQSEFKLPIVLWESFEDETSPDSVWFHAKKEYEIGDTISVISNNGYPFDHVLEQALGSRDSINMLGDTIVIYDSIYVKDIIASRLFVAADGKSNPSYNANPLLFFTRDAIRFNKQTEWWVLANKSANTIGTKLAGIPLSLTVTKDGNTAFLGTVEGNLFRITNINDATEKKLGDASYTTTVIRVEKLGLTTTQSITSISVDPTDNNKILVTCGNYGNTDYVYYSTNAMDNASTFTSVQGNLPPMPVFSSVIEDGSQLAIIGTEHGVYTATLNGAATTWSFSEGVGDVPVYDLKQQTILKNTYALTTQNGEDTSITEYHGTNNCRAIYAATYGKGLFMCDNFITNPYGVGINEISEPATSNAQLRMFPNPASTYTNVVFNVKGSNADVIYTIYDLAGRMVMNGELGNYSNGTHTASISLNLTSGTYVMQVNVGNDVKCGKIMVY